MAELSITCPRCGKSSPHPRDVTAGYCGNCHKYTHGNVTRGTLKWWILGPDMVPVHEPDVDVWAAWYNEHIGTTCQLAWTNLAMIDERVITVFLAIEADPGAWLFETVLVRPSRPDLYFRTPTYIEALRQHDLVVKSTITHALVTGRVIEAQVREFAETYMPPPLWSHGPSEEDNH